ncbi:MAG: dihydroorotase [Chloroflexi bacterium]|nr:dihydroorotase [Chloroflexota bacterium]
MTSSSQGSVLISGGRVIDPWQNLDAIADILLRDGRVAWTRTGTNVIPDLPADTHRIDAAGMVVTPGFIDLHCHLREPGQEHKETIESGTRAAARGGFTTVCAMPNTEPSIDTPELVKSIFRGAAATASVRVLPIGTITAGRAGRELADLGGLAAAGAALFSDDGSAVANDDLMRSALVESARLGLSLSQHSEDPDVIGNAVAHEGEAAKELGLPSASAEAETNIIERDLKLLAETGGRLHVAHASTTGAVDLLRGARGRGLPVTAEVTPHHLTLTDRALLGERGPEHGWPNGRVADTSLRVNPPLRSEEHVNALVDALREGVIDAIATDHAPHSAQDKAGGFAGAAPGISGIETAFGLLMTALVRTGRIALPALIERLTLGPAKVIGTAADTLGLRGLTPGAAADVVVLDPDRSWTVRSEEFASLGKNTPLEGCELRGMVTHTFVGGVQVYAAEEQSVAHGAARS